MVINISRFMLALRGVSSDPEGDVTNSCGIGSMKFLEAAAVGNLGASMHSWNEEEEGEGDGDSLAL